MMFRISNVSNLYRSASLTAVARELAKFKLDVVDIQGGTEEAM
jgi:hypothetical protein